MPKITIDLSKILKDKRIAALLALAIAAGLAFAKYQGCDVPCVDIDLAAESESEGESESE